MALTALECLATTFFSRFLRPTQSVRRGSAIVFLLLASTPLFCQAQAQSKAHQRDPLLLDVLKRAVNVAGGSEALASVRDLTESGEITFHWAEEVKGSVIIYALGTNRFRMEADLPEGRRTWVVKAGGGSLREPEGKV